MSDGTSKKFGEELLRHEVRVLMTRGVNGLYIYACDNELRKQLEKCAGNYLEYKIDENEIGVLEVAEEKEEYKYLE